jgi:ACS family tartrate transporter-like MFS transporter
MSLAPSRTAIPKVTRRLLPFLFILYIVCFLDRVNIGFAALQMNQDLDLSPAVYGFGAGIFFIGYVLFEVPSNLMLARIGARRWIARIMITWGAIACAMMFVRGPTSLYVLRFLLGASEAGFFPGMIYYLGAWYPPEERARAIARFMVAIPLSGVVGGPISGMLLDLHGAWGLAGWQWLFLLEGLPAVVLGFVVLARLPDRPRDAAWLSSEESAWLEDRVTQEDQGLDRGSGVRQALTHPTIWALAVLFLIGNAFGVYVLGLWLPQIVRDVSGLGNLEVGVLSAIPSLVGAVAMVLVGSHSDRAGERPLHIGGAAAVAAVGLVISASLGSTAIVVFGLSLASAGLLSMHGPFWLLPSTFLSGRAAAAGIALITSVANIGGFLGPYAMGLLKGSTGTYRGGLLILALLSLCGAALALRLRLAPEFDRKNRSAASFSC